MPSRSDSLPVGEAKLLCIRLTWPAFCVQADVFLTKEMKAEAASQGPKEKEKLVHDNILKPIKLEDLKVGEAVMCIDSRDGQQWEASVLKISQDCKKAMVHYKGWGRSSDDWVCVSLLSPKPTEKVLKRIQMYNKFAKWCNDVQLQQKTGPRDAHVVGPVDDVRASFAVSILKESKKTVNAPPRTQPVL